MAPVYWKSHQCHGLKFGGKVRAFFLLLPIAKRISIGKLLTFDREIEQVRQEVRETKLELKQILTAYSSMVSAVSNSINQNVNVHFHPEHEGRRQAQEEIKKAPSAVRQPVLISEKVNDFVESADNDYNYALAKLRMELERAMREALGLAVENNNPARMRSGHLSARQMFKQLMDRSPRFVDMHHSFDYVTKVCNAAIHGQQVLGGHAQEAIQMGVILLEEIRLEERVKQF